MNYIIKQAKLPILQQRLLLLEQYSTEMVGMDTIQAEEFLDRMLFYPLSRSRYGRINKNGTVVDVFRDCICDINYTHDYCTVSVHDGEKIKTMYLHRLLGEVFLPLPEIGSGNTYDVNHKDCDKHNFELSNLEWTTRLENVKHAIRNRRADTDECFVIMPNKLLVKTQSIEEASRLSGISSAMILWRLNFVVIKPRDSFDFKYAVDRITPRSLGISKNNANTYFQHGKQLPILSSVELYDMFPELTRPRNSYKNVKYRVRTISTGKVNEYLGSRLLEQKTNICRRYLTRWFDEGDGRICRNGYEVTKVP